MKYSAGRLISIYSLNTDGDDLRWNFCQLANVTYKGGAMFSCPDSIMSLPRHCLLVLRPFSCFRFLIVSGATVSLILRVSHFSILFIYILIKKKSTPIYGGVLFTYEKCSKILPGVGRVWGTRYVKGSFFVWKYKELKIGNCRENLSFHFRIWGRKHRVALGQEMVGEKFRHALSQRKFTFWTKVRKNWNNLKWPI